jgi:hypothetical protein
MPTNLTTDKMDWFLDKTNLPKLTQSWALVFHACNPSYLGG